jgi:hypothetical protein
MRVIAKISHWLYASRLELVFFGGVIAVSLGAWAIYPPAGLLTGGGLLVWISIPTRRFPIVFGRREEH